MSTMRAVQITAPGDTSILKVSSIPKPVPKPNEVLIKVHYASVNFADTLRRSGKFTVSYPFVPGAEGSGEIVSLGSSVTSLSVGDRVAFLGGATYAEYAVAEGDRVVKIPEGVSYEKAAAALSNGMSSMGLSQLAHKVQKGDWVLIHAVAGGVGLVLTQLCKQAGAHVIGRTSSDAKADLAKRAGADYVFNYKTLSHDEIIAQINKVTNGQMVDVVYDSVGADTFDLSLRSVRSFGTVVLYGLASGKVPPVDLMARLVGNAAKLTFFSVYTALRIPGTYASLANATLKLVADDKLDPNIFKIYALDDAKDAHDAIESRQSTGKLLLKL